MVAVAAVTGLIASALGAGSVAARTRWRIERPLRLVPYSFEGAACVKGTKTCWVTGGTFGAVPALAKTTNGGAGWSVPPSSAINPRQAGIAAVSCPSLSRCIGVGGQMGRAQSAQVGSAVLTNNGGRSWSLLKMPSVVFSKPVNTNTVLQGISCSSASRCIAVGFQGIVIATKDGGSKWTAQSSGTTRNLRGVSCPTKSHCFAVGDVGTVIATTNGGKTWSPQTSGTTSHLYGVSCPSTTTCYAVGSSGRVIKTTDGGTTPWTTQVSGTTNLLRGVSCPHASTCYAVGDSGTVIKTTNGGITLKGK